MRRRVLIGGVGVAAALAGVAAAMWQSQKSLTPAEAGFWSMRFEQPGGGELVLAKLRGKPLLLNFWATWCLPCVTEMPMLDRFQHEQKPRGWEVVGLAIDSPTPVREFLRQRPVSFAVGLAGADGVDLGQALGNTGGGLPFSVVFDRSGKVVHRKLGLLQPPELQAWVAAIS